MISKKTRPTLDQLEKIDRYLEQQQTIIDEFIKVCTTGGKMTCGEILEKCEDMGYNTTLKHIIDMMHKHPHKIDNSAEFKSMHK